MGAQGTRQLWCCRSALDRAGLVWGRLALEGSDAEGHRCGSTAQGAQGLGFRAWDLGLGCRGEWVKQYYGELGEVAGRWEVWGDACRQEPGVLQHVGACAWPCPLSGGASLI